jgi:hypothetical protein
VSFEVVVFALEERERSFRVRWRVGKARFTRTFTTKALADGFRAQLLTATRRGELFSDETGLPPSMDKTRGEATFYQLAIDFTRSAWPSISAKQRASVVETLSRVVPVVVRDLAGAPDPGTLRTAISYSLIQGSNPPVLAADKLAALGWLRRASRPVTVLTDASTLADVLDALAVNLDGKPAAPSYFSRRRRVLHRVLGYAVRRKLLDSNPLTSLPDGLDRPG